jgi:predicted GIY-YIG superfamily endonuclease
MPTLSSAGVEGCTRPRQRKVGTAWVYLLECSDHSYYVGCTTDLAQRIEQHQQGTFSGYTARRRPVLLKWCGETNDIHNAIAAERQIKGWSRAKKEALTRGDWKALHVLSLSTQARERRKKRSKRGPGDSLRLRAGEAPALRSD